MGRTSLELLRAHLIHLESMEVVANRAQDLDGAVEDNLASRANGRIGASQVGVMSEHALGAVEDRGSVGNRPEQAGDEFVEGREPRENIELSRLFLYHCKSFRACWDDLGDVSRFFGISTEAARAARRRRDATEAGR
jgi:hypothetical protein